MLKRSRLLLLFLIVLQTSAFAAETYQRNPHVSDEIWEKVSPYFLPLNHAIKPILDSIFNGTRVIASKQTLAEAGFIFTEVQGTQAYVMQHPLIKGYVIKLYPDDKPTRVDWVSWTNRIIGANLLKQAFKIHKCDKIFKVANKWIYPLPAEPSPTTIIEQGGRKNFILIVENVKPLSRRENWAKWRRLKKENILTSLYKVTRRVGAGDCVRANNLPWCEDGKIGFVDTEIYYRWPINYHPLMEVLNKKMQPRWKKITQDGSIPRSS